MWKTIEGRVSSQTYAKGERRQSLLTMAGLRRVTIPRFSGGYTVLDIA